MNNVALKGMFMRKSTFIFLNSLLVLIVIFLVLLVIRDVLSGTVHLKKTGPADAGLDVSAKGVRDLNSYSVILERNPFGFDAGKLSALTSHAERKGNSAVSGNYRLIGTIATGGDDSFAVFQSDGKQFLYRVKENIAGLGILDRIETDRVFVRGAGGMQELELVEIKGKGPGRTGGKPGARRGRNDQFVRRDRDGSYVLNSKMVQESISNPQRLMTDARLFPRYKDGKQEGFILKEVRRGGIYDNLGLKNGDILLRVNEYDITNPESALQAFTALKGVDKLQLDVIRNGATVTKTYHVK